MKYISQLSIVLFSAIGFASCSSSSEKKKEAAIEKESYQLISLQPRSIGSEVQLPGVMQSFEFVQMFPKINGFVKDVYVDRGSVVRKGQVLMKLEAPEIEEHVSAAKLKYTEAHANYVTSKDRYKRLLETSKTPGTVSAYDLEAAEAKMQGDSATAQGEYANYKAQEALYGYLTVTAPFDGVITERNVHPGALVGPGSEGNKPMLVLQQQSKLRLVVNIPEQYSAQIKDGDNVKFRVNALPGQDFSGKVSRSSGSLSNNYRAETIEVDVVNPKNIFKPGMYAEVVLPVTGNSNAFVVPRSAVVTTTERKYVVQTNDAGQAQWVDVTEGNQSNDSTEIFGDLKAGSNIVANASYQIKNGEKIK
ncbi:MAG: efflux RND transporter periplasmic adaptor subunit [Bacteroidetes bacterium]|nr:efflux RND transporter periplasmic adaptor subunit [Bacteroidota bacterium]